jgi:hypothetical protein
MKYTEKQFRALWDQKMAAHTKLQQVKKERDGLRSANRVLMAALADRDEQLQQLRSVLTALERE